MQGELSHHLGYQPGMPPPSADINHRNVRSTKTVKTEDDSVRIEVPRDRDGSFEPRARRTIYRPCLQLVKIAQRRRSLVESSNSQPAPFGPSRHSGG